MTGGMTTEGHTGRGTVLVIEDEAAIAELTKTLDKNTKRALKSVRAAADVAQSANPVKGKKNKKS